jgi:hypothetical protein
VVLVEDSHSNSIGNHNYAQTNTLKVGCEQIEPLMFNALFLYGSSEEVACINSGKGLEDELL